MRLKIEIEPHVKEEIIENYEFEEVVENYEFEEVVEKYEFEEVIENDTFNKADEFMRVLEPEINLYLEDIEDIKDTE